MTQPVNKMGDQVNTKILKNVGEGCVKDEFKEFDEVCAIIGNMENVVGDLIAYETATERYLFIVDQYQEQPHLLDPHLESLLSQLFGIIKDEKSQPAVIHLAFKLLYLITKTRGYKIVVRLMPHEVVDLEPVLSMLNKQDPQDFETWETRYMLLLWLSMVCMIPFDMYRLDSTARAQGIEGKIPTMDRIMDIGKRYLDVSDKSRDAASYMLSKFMTRIDVKEKKLPAFLDYALTVLSMTNHESMTLKLGVIRTLYLLFKHGKREDLVPFAPAVLKVIIKLLSTEKDGASVRTCKEAIKLIQRLGLTFLKARVAAWRYKRGNRSLADNLTSEQGSSQSVIDIEEDEEYDIPEELEDVIEQLLIGLKDKDTVVRWSAAKGIGRVLGRLPKELADEVVGSIMELFTITEGDTAWHGGCLALAELGRRGLLLPSRLPDVVPVMIKALNYDQKRGNFSVGAHVRDAACYVCWAFARAYDPEEMLPHVDQIASALVIVSVFDREVNVRRAAAAAFQENVGRQGQFPHGIDILTTCDYFAVGNRNNCYLTLSVFVSQYPEYTQALIDHLVQIKISHWDKSVRELTAKALHNLTPKAPDYMAEKVVPQLITMATSMELSLRHGAILSVAHIIHGLAELNSLKPGVVDSLLGEDVILGLEKITLQLRDGKLFLGVGGELMREAVCCLIAKLSLSRIQYHGKAIINVWRDLIDDCLQHKEIDIQMAGVGAIPPFFTEYGHQDMQEEIIAKYVAKLHDRAENVCCGYALALGALPRSMVQGQFHRVLAELIVASTITERNKPFAEARRDAIKAITSLCVTVGVERNGDPSNCVCTANINRIYDALFSAMKDYTLDSRGDIGAWVREATMSGIHDITSMLVTKETALLTDDICRTMFCSIVQQAVEKIDRTRIHAGETFNKLLYHEPSIMNIPHKKELMEIFPITDSTTSDWTIGTEYALTFSNYPPAVLKKIRQDMIGANWAVPSYTFPHFTKLLGLDAYMYPILLGLTVSVGGLTESLVKCSSASLLSYLKSILDDRTKLDEFCDTLIKIFKDHQKIDRVTLPMIKMINLLQCNGGFNVYADENHKFGLDLLVVCKQEVFRCGEPQKLLASIDVLCGLLQFTGNIQKKIIFQLMVFLCHRYPVVRKTTANKLYEAMVTYDDLVTDDHLDQVLTILSETQWDQQPIAEVKSLRAKLCQLFDVSEPKVKVPATGGSGEPTATKQ